MKTKLLRGWRLPFTVVGTAIFFGCLDNGGKSQAGNSAPDHSAVVTNKTDVPHAAASGMIAETQAVTHANVPPSDLSPGIAELVTLAQSGVGEEVLMAYVEKSGRTFNPTVEEIIYLKDIGLPEAVIAALVRKGNLTNVVELATSPEPAAPIDPATTNVIPPSLGESPTPTYSVTAEPVPAAPVQNIDINYFETSLAPYGTWVDVPDYGRCWQPTVVVVNRSWRPYSDRGRWLYTSAGWYWQSDYSWGWAPFHYGRWHEDYRFGWVWVPDTTWGPSWVSWRYTDRYCGWAPLPPTAHYRRGSGFYYRNARVGISFDFGLRDDCYTFIPTSRFYDPRPYRYYAPRSHSKTIYRDSVVINNYINGNNNTIINEGIGRDRISRSTQTPIRTVAIRDLPTTASPVGRADRLEKEGNDLVVFRPNSSGKSSLVRSPTRQAASLNGSAVSIPSSSSSLRSIPSINQRTITAPSQAPTALPMTPASRGASVITRSPEATPSRSLPNNSSTPPVGTQSGLRSVTPSGVGQTGTSGLRELPTQNPTRQLPAASSQVTTIQAPQAPQATISNSRTLPSPQSPARTEVRSIPPAVTRSPSVISPNTAPVQRNLGSTTPAAVVPSQRSIRSIPPSQPSIAPPQSQPRTFTAPPPVNGGANRVQRAPQQGYQAPAPVVAPSAPMRTQAPRVQSAPASRERVTRSIRDRN